MFATVLLVTSTLTALDAERAGGQTATLTYLSAISPSPGVLTDSDQ
jgi:hypothetical protein